MLRTAIVVVLAWLVAATGPAMAATTDGDISARLQAALNGGADTLAAVQASDLKQVYEVRQFAPLWWQNGAWSAKAHDAITALSVSYRHGIDGARYGVDALQALMARDPASLGGDLVATGDLALTAAMLSYLKDQTGGRIDPASTKWYARTVAAGNAPALLIQGLDAPDFAGWLAAQAPTRNGYGALADAMTRLERLTDEPWADLERAGLIRPGDADERIPEIRHRLMLLGDYHVVRPNQIAATAAASDSTTYDHTLVAAVARFQARHGLEDDGIIGPKTMAALNVSPAERVQTIAVNLERLRWMPDPAAVQGRHIVVNVAGFELTAYVDGTPALSMPVIVGQPGHKTPLLADQIINVKFAPTWTVPDRIASRELLPKIQNDPGYLRANNFRVFLDHAATVEVDPSQVDWASLSSGYMPYMLRQDPGPSNALGMIRFSLSNSLNIYMHDTGSRQLFAEAERSLSHGCVRVGAPVALADFVLDGLDRPWTPEEIETAMAGSRPQFQVLAAPVPVDLVYLTAWVDADGVVQFRSDIYGYDGVTEDMLEVADRVGPTAVGRLIDALAAIPESPTVTASLDQG